MATIDNTVFTYNFQNFMAYPTFENWQNVVFNIMWTYTATYTDPVTKKVWTNDTRKLSNISTNDITDFVPYNQITEQMAIDWVTAGEDMTSVQQGLVAGINNQINPPPPSIVILPPPFAQ